MLAGAGLVASVAVAVAAFAAPAQSVAVTAGKPGELRFTLSKKTVRANIPVVFTVTNKGALKHDFKVAGKKTVLLAPGAKRTLRVTFSKTGKFTYLCTVAGHAAGGMKGTLTATK